MKQTKQSIALMITMLLLFSVILPSNTVEASSSKITLNKKTSTIYVGSSCKLKVTGTTKTVKWTSSKKSIASVNSSGKVTGKKKGTATITAKVGSKKLACKVTVKNIALNKTKLTLKKGKTYNLKLNGGTVKSWNSNNKAIATVSSKGKVIAKKAGTATITCLAKTGKKYKCNVTVTATVTNTPTPKPTTTPKPTHTHEYELVSSTNATCTQQGVKEYICKSCGDKKTEYTNKLEHDFDDGRVTKEASCEQDGEKTYTCRRCFYEKTEVIPALNHSYALKTKVNPTCTDSGYELYVCTKCGDEKKIVDKALGHSYVATWISATNTTSGYNKCTCSRCNDSYNDYSSSRQPTILDDWDYKLYKDEKIIDLERCRKSLSQYSESGLENVYIPGEFKIDGVTYKTAIGYNEKIEISQIFSTDMKNHLKTVTMDGVTIYNGYQLFISMPKLKTLNFTNIKCNPDTELGKMFKDCTSLENIDLGTLDFKNVGSTYQMFKGCTNLKTVTLPKNTVAAYLTNAGSMFEDCTNLTTLNNSVGTTFDMAAVKYLGGTFRNCKKLTSSRYDFITSQDVATTNNMFMNCESLQNVCINRMCFSDDAIAEAKANSSAYMGGMFTNCTSLNNIEVNTGLYLQMAGHGWDSILVNTPAVVSIKGASNLTN